MSETNAATAAEHAITYYLAWGRLWAACLCGWEFECASPVITERAGQVHLKRIAPPPSVEEGW